MNICSRFHPGCSIFIQRRKKRLKVTGVKDTLDQSFSLQIIRFLLWAYYLGQCSRIQKSGDSITSVLHILVTHETQYTTSENDQVNSSFSLDISSYENNEEVYAMNADVHIHHHCMTCIKKD